jgi:hypothetical protein
MVRSFSKMRFSLRSVVLATLLIALPVAWFTSRLREARREEAMVNVLETMGATILYDYHTTQPRPRRKRPELVWPGTWFGKHFVSRVTYVRFFPEYRLITDEDLTLLQSFAELRTLDLTGNAISDAGLAHLYDMHSLERLMLYDTNVTREGVNKLQAELSNCFIETDWYGMLQFSNRRTREGLYMIVLADQRRQRY